MEVEDEIRLESVMRALRQLTSESAIWGRNHRAFANFSLEKKHAWWLHAQQMSDQNLPMYRILVAKVIQLRMS